jgi:hypothetical protein
MAIPNNQRRGTVFVFSMFRLFAAVLIAITAVGVARGQAISFNEALDDDLVWTSVRDELQWIPETDVSHDGVSAVKAGPARPNWVESATLRTTVTGPAIVSFWWKASAASLIFYSSDFTVFVDGDLAAERYGQFDWTNDFVTIGNGTHTIQWHEAIYGDAVTAWLDSVQVTPITPEPPTIVTSPASQTVWPHDSVTLTCEAMGTPALTYHWYHNGSAAYTSKDPNFTIAKASVGFVGTYSVVVQNVFGSATSSQAVVALNSLPLDDSLDAGNMHWEDVSSGPSHWFGQTNVTSDGGDAAESWLPYNFPESDLMRSTVTGPARFAWSLLVGPFQYGPSPNTLVLKMDGKVSKSYDGSATNWIQDNFDVPFGTHQLQWEHSSGYTGSVWLDQFSFTPLSGDAPTIVTQPQSITIAGGENFQLEAAASSDVPSACTWLFHGQVVGRDTTLQFTNTTPLQGGAYFAVFSNLFGLTTSAVATVTVTTTIPLAQALNTTNLVWVTDPTQPWFGETTESHDGVAAAQCSGSWLDTTVEGPGLLTFWSKSIASYFSSFEMTDNGVFTGYWFDGGNETDGSGWYKQYVQITAGTHHLRFSSSERDWPGPWVDEMRFTPGVFTPPRIVQAPRDAVVGPNEMATFRVIAKSSLPMRYQWFDNVGAEIEGATNDSVNISTEYVYNVSGLYICVVSNGVGSTTASARLIARSGFMALGNAATRWDNDPTTPWTLVRDPQRGFVARSSGPGQTLSAQVIGPGKLSFWWKLSADSSDKFDCTVSYGVAATMAGGLGWRQQTVSVPPGPQTVSWFYEKHSSVTRTDEHAWLGKVTFLPDVPVSVRIEPSNLTKFEGERAVFKAVASGTGPFTYQWYSSAGWMGTTTNSTFVINPVTLNSAGWVWVEVTTPSTLYNQQATLGTAILQVRSAVEGQRVMQGTSARMVLNTAVPGEASIVWTNNSGRVRDINGNHGASTRTLTIGKSNITNETDIYSVTARTGSGWNFYAAGALISKRPGAVVGWGTDNDGNETTAPDLDDVVALSASFGNGVALHSDGTVTIFGQPQQMSGDWTNITAVAAGEGATIGLRSDETVLMAHSSNYYPTQLPDGLTNVASISACVNHFVAAKADGSVVAWGSNHYGESMVPADLTDVVSVSAGFVHDLALKRDGSIVGWGDNESGQLIPPPSATNVVAISAGWFHNLALRADGTVVAWGENGNGQADVPRGLKDVVAIAAGNTDSVALKRDGTVVTWGGAQSELLPIASGTVPQGLKNVAAIAVGATLETYAIIYAPVFATNLMVNDLGNGGSLLTVAVRGRKPMTYQWRLNRKAIPNATGAELIVANPTSAAEAGRMKYDVVVRNSYGTVTSASVKLPVYTPPPSGVVETAPPHRPPVTPPIPPVPVDGGSGLIISTTGGYRPPLSIPNGLRLQRSGETMVLIWPDVAGGVLESTDDLSRGFAADANQGVRVSPGVKGVSVNPSVTQRFYRVRMR